MFVKASSSKHWALACLIVSALICFFVLLIHEQIFRHGSGDFSTHAKIQDMHYTYFYVMRDTVVDLARHTPLQSLATILYVTVALNICVVFYFFYKESTAPLIAALATGVMFFFVPVFNLVDGDIYLGQLSPNIWHNSTFLLAATPNLLLFLYGMSVMQQPLSVGRVLLLTLFAILSIGAKPSLFVVIVPAVTLYTLIFRRDLILRVGVLWALPVMCFVIYYFFILPKDVETIIAPGLVWAIHSNNIPYSILTSSIFFLVLAASYKKSFLTAPEIMVAALAVGVGMVQFYLLAEPGVRQQDANFSWGMHQAMTLLLFSSLVFLMRQRWDGKLKIALLACVPHLVTGLYYNLYILRTGGYWI